MRRTERTIIVRGLDNISIDLKEGDRDALIGHNGSRKTTLLRVFPGVYAPTQDRAEISGHTISLINIDLGIHPDATWQGKH